MKMVADRQEHVAHHNKHCFLGVSTSMTLNDPELPKYGVLVNFLRLSSRDAHIKSELA